MPVLNEVNEKGMIWFHGSWRTPLGVEGRKKYEKNRSRSPEFKERRNAKQRERYALEPEKYKRLNKMYSKGTRDRKRKEKDLRKQKQLDEFRVISETSKATSQ